MPPGPRAVTYRSGGSVLSATISEWYRAAGKGRGRPVSKPRPSWLTGEEWPWAGSLAARDTGTVSGRDGLVTEADAQQRRQGAALARDGDADSGFGRRSRPGGNHDPVRSERGDVRVLTPRRS